MCAALTCYLQIFAHNGTHQPVTQRSTALRQTLDLECDESPNTRLKCVSTSTCASCVTMRTIRTMGLQDSFAFGALAATAQIHTCTMP